MRILFYSGWGGKGHKLCGISYTGLVYTNNKWLGLIILAGIWYLCGLLDPAKESVLGR